MNASAIRSAKQDVPEGIYRVDADTLRRARYGIPRGGSSRRWYLAIVPVLLIALLWISVTGLMQEEPALAAPDSAPPSTELSKLQQDRGERRSITAPIGRWVYPATGDIYEVKMGEGQQIQWRALTSQQMLWAKGELSPDANGTFTGSVQGVFRGDPTKALRVSPVTLEPMGSSLVFHGEYIEWGGAESRTPIELVFERAY